MKKDKQINILLSEDIYNKFSKMCQFQGSYASTKTRELIVQWVNENEALWQNIIHSSVQDSIIKHKTVEVEQDGERYTIEFSLEEGGIIKSFKKLEPGETLPGEKPILDLTKIDVKEIIPNDIYADNLDLFEDLEEPNSMEEAPKETSNEEVIDLDLIKRLM